VIALQGVSENAASLIILALPAGTSPRDQAFPGYPDIMDLRVQYCKDETMFKARYKLCANLDTLIVFDRKIQYNKTGNRQESVQEYHFLPFAFHHRTFTGNSSIFEATTLCEK
jgi:hypothetical protein